MVARLSNLRRGKLQRRTAPKIEPLNKSNAAAPAPPAGGNRYFGSRYFGPRYFGPRYL